MKTGSKEIPPPDFTARQRIRERSHGMCALHCVLRAWRNERLCYTDKFEDPDLPGVIHVSVTPKAVFCRTGLNVVQEGPRSDVAAQVPAAIAAHGYGGAEATCR